MLVEFLEYLKFVANMRCNYSDESVLRFDDYFRRTAKSEGLPLHDERFRKTLGDKHFHSACRKPDLSFEQAKSSNQPFRAKGLTVFQNKRRYNFPCCFLWQEISVSKPQLNVPTKMSVATAAAIIEPLCVPLEAVVQVSPRAGCFKICVGERRVFDSGDLYVRCPLTNAFKNWFLGTVWN